MSQPLITWKLNAAGVCRALAITLLGLFMAGCSVQGEITDLTKHVTISRMGAQFGFVSGANQTEEASGYKVSSSVGHWHDGGGKAEVVNGYQIYSGVQGSLNSETSIEVLNQ